MFPRKSVQQHEPDLASLRPAIVEGKLMTDKRARDSKYVASLVEELRHIEHVVAAAESHFELTESRERECVESCPESVTWFHEKCAELDRRIRRLGRGIHPDNERLVV